MGILMSDADSKKFYYCDEKSHFDINDVLSFVSEIGAVAFGKSKKKNVNGFWQIACFNKKGKINGFILTKSEKIRMTVHKELTK